MNQKARIKPDAKVDPTVDLEVHLTDSYTLLQKSFFSLSELTRNDQVSHSINSPDYFKPLRFQVSMVKY